MNKIELNGADFLIEVNEISADLFADDIYNSEVELSIDLPFVNLISLADFLEGVVVGDCDSKEFKIDISSDDGSKIQLVGSGLSWGMPVAVLGISFVLELRLWCRLTAADIMEISRLQSKTWVDVDETLSGEEITAVWDKKWRLLVEELG